MVSQSTPSTKPRRYSLSGMPGRIGWSGGWWQCSSTRTLRRASRAAGPARPGDAAPERPGDRARAEVMRAGVGDEDPAGLEQPERAQVDLLVAAQRPVERALRGY